MKFFRIAQWYMKQLINSFGSGSPCRISKPGTQVIWGNELPWPRRSTLSRHSFHKLNTIDILIERSVFYMLSSLWQGFILFINVLIILHIHASMLIIFSLNDKHQTPMFHTEWCLHIKSHVIRLHISVIKEYFGRLFCVRMDTWDKESLLHYFTLFYLLLHPHFREAVMCHSEGLIVSFMFLYYP